MEDELKEMPISERIEFIKEMATTLGENYESKWKQIERCKKCCMATYTGSGWYCPLPYCWRNEV